MDSNEMKVEMVDIDRIVPYDGNPRLNDEAVDSVAKSIESYGFRQPIVVDRDMVIIVGHTRRLAALKLGLKEVPCVIAGDLTPEQAKAYRLDDNKTAEFATWDFSRLSDEMKELDESGYDMDSLAFSSDEVESLLGMTEEEEEDLDEPGETDEDSVPDMAGESVDSELGRGYKLGEGLLLCMDEMEYRHVLGKCGCAIVDHEFKDSEEIEGIADVLKKASGECSPLFFMSSSQCGYGFYRALCDNDLHLSERIAYTVPSESEKGRFVRNVDTIDVVSQEEPYINDGFSNFIEGVSETGEKSVELFRHLVKSCTSGGDSVFIPFAGTGAAVIACQQSGRKFIAIEKSPEKCDVIRKRWSEFVNGKEADWKKETGR